jgi:transcriptional regulator with XRE-family HTH domain
MTDSYFTAARVEKYRGMLRSGNQEGIRRMEFGRVIYHIRRSRSRGLTQLRAAKLAKLTRVQWNRIENGKTLPRRSTILRLARALNTPSSILFRAAGYDVPKKDFLYDRKRAHERLDAAMDDSKNKAEFLLHMEAAWEEWSLDTVCVEVGLPDQIRVRVTAGLVAYINEHLTKLERVQLAEELVQSSPDLVVDKVVGDLGDFYARIGERLREYVSPAAFMATIDNDSIP